VKVRAARQPGGAGEKLRIQLGSRLGFIDYDIVLGLDTIGKERSIIDLALLKDLGAWDSMVSVPPWRIL